MYNFTSFAVTLNELEPGMERLLPPTDCRLRPDIRAMENGDIGRSNLPKEKRSFHSPACFNSCFLCLTDAASNEKERLEEKQRAARRERSKEEEEWTTRCVFLPQIREVLIRVLSVLQSNPDSVQVVSAGDKPSHRRRGLAVHRRVLWQELHWLSQHLLTPGGAVVTCSSGILLIFATRRHWCRVFVWVEEKLIKHFKFFPHSQLWTQVHGRPAR